MIFWYIDETDSFSSEKLIASLLLDFLSILAYIFTQLVSEIFVNQKLIYW